MPVRCSVFSKLEMIDLSPRHLATVKSILAEHVPECEVRAYGSRARWTARDYSDVDLAVVGKGPLDRGVIADLKEAFQDSDLPMRVDVLDWHGVSVEFRDAIRAEAVVLAQGRWRSVSLGHACTKIGSGATPRGGKDVYLPSGPYALIRSQNVLNDGFRHEGLAYIGEQHAADLAGVEVKEGDVLLNITGDSVARACQVDPSILPARVNQHVAIVRPDPTRLEPRFLRYSLVLPNAQAKLLSWAGAGGTRKALTKGMIEAFDIQAPEDVSEQRAIAGVLGTLDDKIELNRRMNETLEAMARALFKSWFVDFDPVRAKMEGRDTGLPDHLADLFPDRLVDSEMGEIPEGWEVSEIGNEVKAVGGTTPSTKDQSYWDRGHHCWATPKDLSQLDSPVLLETNRKVTNAGLRKISSGALPVGTVLLSSRAPIGYLAITEVHTAVNQGFIAMICDQRLPNLYVLRWCDQNLDHIRNIAGGSTFAEISKKVFRPVPVLVPPAATLGVYERLSRPLHERLVANTKDCVTLRALRDTLLPKLISGEIRVPDAERTLTLVT